MHVPSFNKIERGSDGAKSLDGILCIKLTSKSTDYSLLLLTCYLPPENSVWGRNSQQFISHVLSYIYINNECTSVFVCGDFNARIGSLDDLTDFDDVNILKRHVLDKTINQHGHSFIDFLNEAKVCILKTEEELNKLVLPFLSFSL